MAVEVAGLPGESPLIPLAFFRGGVFKTGLRVFEALEPWADFSGVSGPGSASLRNNGLEKQDSLSGCGLRHDGLEHAALNVHQSAGKF